MENTSHALHIVIGVLIAILLIGLVLFVFRAMGRMEKSGDNILVAENKAEFNEAFLAFDKPLMYGTDVLSCLNKAQSNNQKYVYSNYYGKDSNNYEARLEYRIDVKVKLKTTVKETVKVYYKNNIGKLVESMDVYNSFKPFSNPNGFKLPTVNYYYFQGTGNVNKLINGTNEYKDVLWGSGVTDKIKPNETKLQTKTYDTSLKKLTGTDEYYSILNDATGKLSALLSTVTNVEQTILNSSYTGGNDWYSATWRSAAYDFKTRKFKCTDVSYNNDTGYINSMTFVEL